MKYKLLLFLIITPLLFVDAATITNRGIGSASFFTGSVDPTLSAADNNVYDLGSTFTLEAWVIPYNPINSDSNIIAKFTGGAGSRCWRIQYTGTALNFIASAVCDNPVTTSSVTITLPVGRCSHIAITQNLVETDFYVNGKLIGAPGLGPIPGNGTNNFRIGGTNDGGTAFNGVVDEVRIWNVARTQAQISEYMNRELNGNETGLTGYFTLNRSNFLLSSLPGVATDLTNNNSVPSLSQSCLQQGSGASLF